MTREPNFDDLIGAEVTDAEREQLRRTHELLLEAGPPPELPPSLQKAPNFGVFSLRQRRVVKRRALVLLAAVSCAAGFALRSRFTARCTATFNDEIDWPLAAEASFNDISRSFSISIAWRWPLGKVSMATFMRRISLASSGRYVGRAGKVSVSLSIGLSRSALRTSRRRRSMMRWRATAASQGANGLAGS